MNLSPLRRFVLSAALWLPACFFLWAVFAGVVIWPVGRITALALEALVPDVIGSVTQLGASLEVETRLQTTASADGRIGLFVLTINPLIYAWCLALFAGLVMATPLEVRQRLVQLVIGLCVLWLVSAWGATFDVLKLLAFDAGPVGAASVTRAGWSQEAVALGYQFGYLILPAVTPIVLWVLFNRRFLEELVGWEQELDPPAAGPSPTPTAAGPASGTHAEAGVPTDRPSTGVDKDTP